MVVVVDANANDGVVWTQFIVNDSTAKNYLVYTK